MVIINLKCVHEITSIEFVTWKGPDVIPNISDKAMKARWSPTAAFCFAADSDRTWPLFSVGLIDFV